ncbi:hypothetical protein JL720_6379 [Aureococcus anophagefferens]|nr:hypothetical protein JL720_6379 [Aureococcus anophagefferens]
MRRGRRYPVLRLGKVPLAAPSARQPLSESCPPVGSPFEPSSMMLYQGGASCELLGASGKDPLKRWKAKASGGVKRLYDSGTRGYVYSIDGGAATRLALGDGAPRSSRGAHSLGLLHRYLVLQLELPPSDARPFAVELVVSDEKRNRRRVLLSSAFAAASRTPLHAQLPLGGAFEGKRGKWLHWRVDVAGLAKVAFGEAVALHALDGVAVGPSCRLRAVFTLRDAESPVPTSLALPAAVGYEEAVFPPDEAPGAPPEPPSPLGVFGTAIPRSEKAPPRNPTPRDDDDADARPPTRKTPRAPTPAPPAQEEDEAAFEEDDAFDDAPEDEDDEAFDDAPEDDEAFDDAPLGEDEDDGAPLSPLRVSTVGGADDDEPRHADYAAGDYGGEAPGLRRRRRPHRRVAARRRRAAGLLLRGPVRERPLGVRRGVAAVGEGARDGRVLFDGLPSAPGASLAASLAAPTPPAPPDASVDLVEAMAATPRVRPPTSTLTPAAAAPRGATASRSVRFSRNPVDVSAGVSVSRQSVPGISMQSADRSRSRSVLAALDDDDEPPPTPFRDSYEPLRDSFAANVAPKRAGTPFAKPLGTPFRDSDAGPATPFARGATPFHDFFADDTPAASIDAPPVAAPGVDPSFLAQIVEPARQSTASLRVSSASIRESIVSVRESQTVVEIDARPKTARSERGSVPAPILEVPGTADFDPMDFALPPSPAPPSERHPDFDPSDFAMPPSPVAPSEHDEFDPSDFAMPPSPAPPSTAHPDFDPSDFAMPPSPAPPSERHPDFDPADFAMPLDEPADVLLDEPADALLDEPAPPTPAPPPSRSRPASAATPEAAEPARLDSRRRRRRRRS